MQPRRIFDPALDVSCDTATLSFRYGPGVFGPRKSELRRLDDVRCSLLDPNCDGPDPLYGIVMDVGRVAHQSELRDRMLLFGVVAFAPGRLGDEPVRSQGHVHAVAPHCGCSTPEVIEVWRGRAIVFLQQFAAVDAGRCVAIELAPGGVAVIPPGWAHCVMNAAIHESLIFGAFCDRQYAFEYDAVRARGGLSWFAHLDETGEIAWRRNPRYSASELTLHTGRAYPELGLDPSLPIYQQFANAPACMQWVSQPAQVRALWDGFEP